VTRFIVAAPSRIGLAARFEHFYPVVIGTTLGMMLANIPAVLLGNKVADKTPVKAIRITAGVVFALLGLLTSQVLTNDYCARGLINSSITTGARPGRTSPRRGAILLQAAGAQAAQAMCLIGALPGAEFLFRKLVAAAGFLESDLAALHRGDHRCLAADHPSLNVGRRQLAHRRRPDR
jgi:Uncharacterized protein family UPF0016